MCEQLGISELTEKGVKGGDYFAIKEHLLLWNLSLDFEVLSILTTSNNNFKVPLMETFIIDRDHPLLNKNNQSLPLEFFDK